MKFLKTLSWMALAVLIAVFAGSNWNDVTINLWGNLKADVKLPFLLLLIFLIGFLPPYLIMRGRVWNLNRKLAVASRPPANPAAPAPSPQFGEEEGFSAP
ncbi:MAG TPA: hypothetical protein VNJ05_09895 [Sphingomicrobium sp.]|nr:hypothetical protein [Sphingomicrobium sp.]